jgi:hypothetical protein
MDTNLTIVCRPALPLKDEDEGGAGEKKKAHLFPALWEKMGFSRSKEQFYIVLRMHAGSRSCSG